MKQDIKEEKLGKILDWCRWWPRFHTTKERNDGREGGRSKGFLKEEWKGECQQTPFHEAANRSTITVDQNCFTCLVGREHAESCLLKRVRRIVFVANWLAGSTSRFCLH
jgi:hypothetical protein